MTLSGRRVVESMKVHHAVNDKGSPTPTPFPIPWTASTIRTSKARLLERYIFQWNSLSYVYGGGDGDGI